MLECSLLKKLEMRIHIKALEGVGTAPIEQEAIQAIQATQGDT